MNYRVHLFPTVRLVLETTASSQEEALRLALEEFEKRPGQYLGYSEWDEGPIAEALVDEEGDDEYLRSHLYRLDEEGTPQKEE